MTRLVAARRVAEILARVDRVRALLPAELATFLAERTAAEALILNLYLALQATSDLALHLVADRGLAVPARDELGELVEFAAAAAAAWKLDEPGG